jgi:hypothetical protein
MTQWTAEIMTDPARNHKLHVELKEDDRYRARLYQDEEGRLQLQLYDGLPAVVPVQWLLDVVARFGKDVGMTRGEERSG